KGATSLSPQVSVRLFARNIVRIRSVSASPFSLRLVLVICHHMKILTSSCQVNMSPSYRIDIMQTIQNGKRHAKDHSPARRHDRPADDRNLLALDGHF